MYVQMSTLISTKCNYEGLVAQRITRLTTDQKIVGSNPAVLEDSFCKFWKYFVEKYIHIAITHQQVAR